MNHQIEKKALVGLEILSGVKISCPGNESSDWEEGTSRIGNTLWCSCGKYKPIATHAARISCKS